MGSLRFLGLFIAFISALSVATPSTRIALSLDKSEPYVLNLFHAGYYFTGHSRQTETESHRIEVYSADLSKKVKDIALTHTVESIAPLSPTQVLVIGKHFGSEWHGYYTVIDTANLTAKTTEFSTEFMPEFFAGAPGKLYFNEAGNAGVFSWSGGSGQMLPLTLSGPGRMAFTGNYLYVVERRDLLFFGDERLTRIDVKTNKSEVVSGLGKGLSQIQYLPKLGLIAVPETLANKVHLVDPNTNKIVLSFESPSPEGVFPVEKCVAVSSRDEKRATLVRVAGNAATVAGSWDLTDLGGNLLNTRHITADVSGKRLYVRSQDLCPTCVSSRNVVAVVEGLDEAFKTCAD